MTVQIDLEEYTALIEKAVRSEMAVEFIDHGAYPTAAEIRQILTGEYPVKKAEAD